MWSLQLGASLVSNSQCGLLTYIVEWVDKTWHRIKTHLSNAPDLGEVLLVWRRGSLTELSFSWI